MRITAVIDVLCWDGRTKKVTKIEIYVIKDQQEETLFKIEGSMRDEVFMIAFYKSREVAMEHYGTLMERLLEAQEVEAA